MNFNKYNEQLKLISEQINSLINENNMMQQQQMMLMMIIQIKMDLYQNHKDSNKKKY